MLLYVHVRAAPADPPRRAALPSGRGRGARPEDVCRGGHPGGDRRGVAGRPVAEASSVGCDRTGPADAGSGSRRAEGGARRASLPRDVIVLDTTVLVYAVGAEHRYREPCRRLLEA